MLFFIFLVVSYGMPTHGLHQSIRKSDLQPLTFSMNWDDFGILGLGKYVTFREGALHPGAGAEGEVKNRR